MLQALVCAAISIGLATFVYRLAKAQKLNFRYTVGWLSLCVLGALGGLISSLIEPVARILGVTSSALIGLIATLLFVLLSIQLSISLSGLQLQNRKLSEELVLIRTGMSKSLNHRGSGTAPLEISDLLIVVPAFNEEKSLGLVVSEIRSAGYRVLVVDDGSTDSTSAIAVECGAEICTLPFNLGVGGALRAGFRFARSSGFSAVIQVDADGQHLVSEIEKLFREANNSGGHLILGSRFRDSESNFQVTKSRRMVMRLLAKSASRATGTKITDPTSGFRLIREPLLSEFSRNFPVNYLGDTYEALVSAGRAGYSVHEISTQMKTREFGVSSASHMQAIKFICKSVVVVSLRLHVRLKQFVK